MNFSPSPVRTSIVFVPAFSPVRISRSMSPTVKDFGKSIDDLEEVFKKGLYKDAKSVLQEKIQKDLKITPTYKVLKEEGPDHAKKFTIGVFFDDKLIAEGYGPSKQDGELEAAHNALEILEVH